MCLIRHIVRASPPYPHDATAGKVFIAKCYAKYAMSEHSSLLVSNEELVARVGDTVIYGVYQKSKNSMKYVG